MPSPDGRPVFIPRVPWHETDAEYKRIYNPSARKTDWQEAKQAALKKVRKDKGPRAANLGYIAPRD